ncbi:MAG TPA: hypothetical protein VJ507_02885 [Candidatus Bathyarchaeia archaeon]|nr:hypothetical protein [Candidatus Bathyarchaeia archaeon]
MDDLIEENAKKPNYNLTVKLSMKKESGVTVEVSTWCVDWENMQKFISQFENILLKGNDGKPQNQDRS